MLSISFFCMEKRRRKFKLAPCEIEALMQKGVLQYGVLLMNRQCSEACLCRIHTNSNNHMQQTTCDGKYVMSIGTLAWKAKAK